jgi:hypothetical protein
LFHPGRLIGVPSFIFSQEVSKYLTTETGNLFCSKTFKLLKQQETFFYLVLKLKKLLFLSV